MGEKKPVIGFFTFTCCEGCLFTILFIDKITEMFSRFDVQYFDLINEKNKEAEFDIAFVEGAITTNKEIEKLKTIRGKSKRLVAIGACACHGGIPAMRNFIENEELKKYVYNQEMLKDSIKAQPIQNFVKVDDFLYGCPIIKDEFVDFCEKALAGEQWKPFVGPVCGQCPRRGKNCYLQEKKECLGAITHGGCNAICVRQNIPCIMCRGPVATANFPAEVKLFESWGISEKDVMERLTRFGDVMKKEDDKHAEKKTEEAGEKNG
ncbi:TPA: hypothetical protein HA265_05265 [Candidatus Woesearchaeota archaeon]|nr:hypothetical protein [Candidatus Woesearchaeota archaeon]